MIAAHISSKDETTPTGTGSSWKSIAVELPFDAFDEMQAAVGARSFNLGVNPLAAAEWMDQFGSLLGRTAINALSLLLFVAGVASVVAAMVTRDYWLLLALPVQAAAFYVSQPASPLRKWVTVAGAASIAFFLDFLLNGWITAASLVAYAGLTFAAVRAAAFIASSSYRRVLLSDEATFVCAYQRGACSLRNNRTRQEYIGGKNR
jgi:hypothetical protein